MFWFFPSLSLFLISLSVPSSPPNAEQVLARAVASRESLKSGVVEVHETWEADGFLVETDATAWFDETHYRFDVHDHSGLRMEHTGPPGKRTDPLRVVFDGDVLLERRVFRSMTSFALRTENDTRIPVTNVRLLGLPGAPPPKLSIERCLKTDAKIESCSSDGAVHTLTLTYPQPGSTPAQMELKVDESKGWSVVEFTKRETTASGNQFVIKGTACPALYDGGWFPSVATIEVWKNGQFDYRRQYVVSYARFNTRLDPDTFTWAGIGIRNGATIVSHVPGMASTQYRSGSAEKTLCDHCARKSAPPAPTDSTSPPNPRR